MVSRKPVFFKVTKASCPRLASAEVMFAVIINFLEVESGDGHSWNFRGFYGDNIGVSGWLHNKPGKTFDGYIKILDAQHRELILT
jgi:hypothetical protein